MKQLLTLAFCLCVSCLFAQPDSDIIHLKNGVIYKGNVTEYIPGGHTVIKLLDDRVITVREDSVRDMKMGNNHVLKKRFDIKQKGYFHNSILGLQFGQSEFGALHINFAYSMVNGYRIGKHHMGIGLGAETHIGKWYAPVYADYSYHIMSGHFSPVIGINGGFMVPMGDIYNDRYNYTEGSFLGGRVGILSYSNPHFAIMLNLTYRYIRLGGASYSDFRFNNDSGAITGSADLHRIGFMLGFVLN